VRARVRANSHQGSNIVRKNVIVLTLLILSGATPWVAAAQPAPSPAPGASKPATEQAWIIASVTAAIEGMSGKTSLPAASIADHVWSPATYRAAAEAAFAPAAADADLDVRAALVDLTSEVLIAQNERVSMALESDMRRPAAHEAAALLVGAFALRESAGWLYDVRPSLSRMAAHLAVARALRRPAADETLDGTLARVLTALAGLQRDAKVMVDAIEPKAASDADRSWVRALRLRITGDWRSKLPPGSPLVVQLEYARAIRERVGMAAFLDYVDGVGPDDGVDWARIAFFDGLSIEAGHRFTPQQIAAEWRETAFVWIAMNGRQRPPDPAELVLGLDARPAASPVYRSGAWVKVRVLDWGMWAAHQQRHLAHAFIARAHFARQLGDDDLYDEILEAVADQYMVLRLFPIVLRWMAEDSEEYELALAGARSLVRETPEDVPQRAWTMLLDTPRYMSRAGAFPLDHAWFTPAVPEGTAFELSARSLRSGAPRPPTREQAARWAREMPYDHWTQWSNQWYAVDGKPSLGNLVAAFGPLLEYDESPIVKLLDHLNMTIDQAIRLSGSLCSFVRENCDRLAGFLLLADRKAEAAQVYDEWADKARDRVGVANGVTWLFRYHVSHGGAARAEALARMAEDVGSRRGTELLAEWHERRGEYAETETLLKGIVDRYDNSEPLGGFLMRRALATRDEQLQTSAAEMLRDAFPHGPQRVVPHALPATASDGVRFASFGPQTQSLGFEQGDIIVAVDGWRVHHMSQYSVALRFSLDENMTFTVFRRGRYEELRTVVAERWLAARLINVRK
jgi:hypothetical protein